MKAFFKSSRSLILDFSKRLCGSSFLGNTTQLLSGEMVAQAVGFAVLPLLTRLYGPSAFGVLGVFMAISEVGGKMSSLRYDVAIVLPLQDREAWALLRFAALFGLSFSLFLFIASFPFRGDISEFFGVDALEAYFPLLALMMLGICWQSLGSFWSLRGKHFRAIAQGSAGSSIVGNCLKVTAGLFGFGVGGLLWGSVMQRWSNLLLIRCLTPSRIWQHETVKGEALRLAIAYDEFPKYRMPQDFLNTLTRQIPNILLAACFSPVTAGFYILAVRILQLPFSLLQEAVRKVFYIKAVEIQREESSLFKLCSLMSLIIFVGMLPIVLILVGWGGVFFEFVFGSEWSTTGLYAKWVILGVLCGFVSVPSAVVLPILGWNRFYLIFEIVSTVLRFSLMVCVALSLTANATVAAIALGSCASSLSLTGIVLIRLRRLESRIQI